MSHYKKFNKNDIVHNTLKTHPYTNFYIYAGNIYHNNRYPIAGENTDSVLHVGTSSISLYEMNVDRQDGQLIYPYLVKSSDLVSFKTVSTNQFHKEIKYGDTITGSYPLSASISRDHFDKNALRPVITSSLNILDSYRVISPHYSVSSSYGYGDKRTQELSVVYIPSIFYGSSIKKGSVDLRLYVTGSLYGRAQDVRQNGELYQTGPTGSVGSGSIVGVVLYNEGLVILTASQDLSNGGHTETYEPGAGSVSPTWIHYGSTGSAGSKILNTAYQLSFKGTQYINTLTMFCHAGAGEINLSKNPTWIQYSSSLTANTSSVGYKENNSINIKNIARTEWKGDPTGSFEKTVAISKIGVYDKNKNLIGIAKIATPTIKRSSDQLTWKIKYDV